MQQKEREGVPEHLVHDAQRDATVEQPDRVHEGQRQQRNEQGPDVPALVVKGQDERHQIDAQRKEPQERHHRDIDRHLVGRRQKQTRPARRQQQPQKHETQAGTIVAIGRFARVGRGISTRNRHAKFAHRAIQGQRASCAQRREHHVSPGPVRRLRPEPDRGLDQERIRQQREQRAQVRQCVQSVRGSPGVQLGEPPLDQWSRRREQQIRRPDRERQDEKDTPDRCVCVGGLQRLGGGDRQRDQGHPQQHRVQDRLPPPRQPADDEVGVGIPAEQHQLEEQQSRGPHTRGRTEPRQDEPGDDRLHLEQQERAEKRRGREQHHGATHPGRRLFGKWLDGGGHVDIGHGFGGSKIRRPAESTRLCAQRGLGRTSSLPCAEAL